MFSLDMLEELSIQTKQSKTREEVLLSHSNLTAWEVLHHICRMPTPTTGGGAFAQAGLRLQAGLESFMNVTSGRPTSTFSFLSVVTERLDLASSLLLDLSWDRSQVPANPLTRSNPDDCAFPTDIQGEMHKSHPTQLEPRLRHFLPGRKSNPGGVNPLYNGGTRSCFRSSFSLAARNGRPDERLR